MFSIIIPNYNGEPYVEVLIETLLAQKFKDFEIIVVDDMSTDNSLPIIKNMLEGRPRVKIIELKEKRYNGGARNVGVEHATGDYILFADCDDWVNNDMCLAEIAKIIRLKHPDIIRLPYRAYINKRAATVNVKEKNLETFTKSVFVAPWTKCVKRELFKPFPENSLLEDVVQHIAQLDVCKTFENCPVPIMVWNRDNKKAISSDTAKYTKDSKRYSSVYRNMADLLDLKCNHTYCEEQRQFRIKAYEDIIKNDGILNLINGGNSQ